MEYSEQLTYEQWNSLIDALRGLTNFRLVVRSSPSDDKKFVYKLAKGRSFDGPEDAINFVVTEDKVVMMVGSPKEQLFMNFVEMLFERPLNRLPLYINDKDEVVNRVVMWRLKNNI